MFTDIGCCSSAQRGSKNWYTTLKVKEPPEVNSIGLPKVKTVCTELIIVGFEDTPFKSGQLVPFVPPKHSMEVCCTTGRP